MIAEHHTHNLETLEAAFAQHHAGLVECERVADGKTVVMLCAIGFDGEEFGITPFAEMVDGNPFELYRPPNPDGGFHPTEVEEKAS